MSEYYSLSKERMARRINGMNILDLSAIFDI
jgi:hypothetical protein